MFTLRVPWGLLKMPCVTNLKAAKDFGIALAIISFLSCFDRDPLDIINGTLSGLIHCTLIFGAYQRQSTTMQFSFGSSQPSFLVFSHMKISNHGNLLSTSGNHLSSMNQQANDYCTGVNIRLDFLYYGLPRHNIVTSIFLQHKLFMMTYE